MRKALVVGINNYPSAPLKGCVKDATDFNKLIQHHEDGSANFQTLLQHDIPTSSKLRGLARELFAGKNEIALFYFSGHGFINELGGFLVMPNHRKDDEGVAMRDLVIMANNSPATNKIIILDCCHSGAITAPALANSAMGHISEGVTILTASRQEEVAIEVNGKGVFTNLLMEALKGGAADLNGNITPGSIYAFIDQALGPWDQRPVFKTNVSRFITLRKVTPQLPLLTLKKITEYFPAPETEHQLSPSYEYSNDPQTEHVYTAPYATEQHIDIFKGLQKMYSAGLVEPVGEEHMYWAAMNGKTCRLTALGAHYWRLVNEKKI